MKHPRPSTPTPKDAAKPAPKAAAKPAPKGRRAAPSARAVAIGVLARVAATDAYLNVVLDAALDELELNDPRDAALATELCYGTSRRLLTLDAVLTTFSERRLETLEDKVLAALRLGAYQLFFTRVPRHAAVADTVEAASLEPRASSTPSSARCRASRSCRSPRVTTRPGWRSSTATRCGS